MQDSYKKYQIYLKGENKTDDIKSIKRNRNYSLW
jgi:hypothetical protein